MRAAGTDEITRRIERGESFLTNLIDLRLDLLPEHKGSSTFWLFHDNYLAAHVLAPTRPDLAQRIRSALVQFGVPKSGKIEILFGEASQPLPFRTYVLTNVAVIHDKTIRTERVTTNALNGWTEYADLLLFASIAQAGSDPEKAGRHFREAELMWDEHGFKDAATRHAGVYSTYKLALYLIAGDRLRLASPNYREPVLSRLLAMQSADDGGWVTDYNDSKPIGVANVETTCLSLLALQTLKRAK